jgi:hypothetical protein
MEKKYKIKLNGIEIKEVSLRPKNNENGFLTGHFELIVVDPFLGKDDKPSSDKEKFQFVVDDEKKESCPNFILEVLDLSIPVSERSFLPNQGWEITTAQKFIQKIKPSKVLQK